MSYRTYSIHMKRIHKIALNPKKKN